MDPQQAIVSAGPRLSAVLPISQLALVCWRGSASARRAIHVEHGRAGCPTPTPPYGESDPTGSGIKEVCLTDECLDIYHDALFGTSDRLYRRWKTGARPADPVRYAASVVRTVLSDRQRTARTAIGWPAKPTRRDGKAAIVNAHLLATAPNENLGQWYITLFRIMRAYATHPDRADASWPIRGLAQERSRYIPSNHPTIQAEKVVREDIHHVLRAAEQAVGKPWVHQIIWHPLLCGLSTVEIPDDLLSPGGDLEDEVLTNWFREEYLHWRRRGATRTNAYKNAARTISGREVLNPTPDLMRILSDVEATWPASTLRAAQSASSLTART